MGDKTAKELYELLVFSVDEQREDLARVASLQDSYDNRINRDVWPTQSEITTAQHFVAVEEALGPALDMCFPESGGLQLLPTDSSVLEDQWRSSEWALWTMINYRMRLRHSALRSIKDCFKCTLGYGIVEPFSITPRVSATVYSGGKSTPVMVDGEPQTSVRYRYVGPGCVLPYPEGSNFNGPEATPISFFFDPYPLWQVEQMFEEGLPDAPGINEMETTLEKVKAAAAGYYRADNDPMSDFRRHMSGRKSHYGQGKPKFAPDQIPIYKVFEQPGTETWWVPDGSKGGEILLRRRSDGVTQVRNGLVKWDAWPDGHRWFPMSQPVADQNRSLAYDMWLNFFFDMMTRTKDSRMVIDKSALASGQRTLDPFEDIYVSGGNAQTAVSYLTPPNIDPSIPMVGDVLDRIGSNIKGTKDFMQKNYTRGGTNAFNDLLNTMQSRQRLSSMILETGALTQIYEHTLAYMQEFVPEGGMELHRPVYDGDNRKTILDRRTITLADLRHGYEVMLDTSERRMLGGMSDQERFNYWQALSERPDVRRAEVNRMFPLPEATLHRIFKTDEQVEEVQQQQTDADLIGRMGGLEGAAPGQEAAPAGAGAPQEGAL